MSDELLIQNCSPTLAGVKSGNLFCCRYSTKKAVFRRISRLNRALSPKGLRVIALRFSPERVLVYVYRPSRLARDLAAPEAREILRREGYDSHLPARCLEILTEKLREGESFPHEIGLFLGYPPEDVRGFIENGGAHCKRVGYWKVYGDEAAACKLFESFDSCTRNLTKLHREGRGIAELAAAG